MGEAVDLLRRSLNNPTANWRDHAYAIVSTQRDSSPSESETTSEMAAEQSVDSPSAAADDGPTFWGWLTERLDNSVRGLRVRRLDLRLRPTERVMECPSVWSSPRAGELRSNGRGGECRAVSSGRARGT